MRHLKCESSPASLEPGALLVKTSCSTICGTDVHLVDGTLNRKVNLPVIAGHEMTGRIAAMGPGSEQDSTGQTVQVGDRIVWTRTNCGHCYMCRVAKTPTLCEDARVYMYENMDHPPHLLGGFSEYVYVLPKSGRVRVPDDVDDALASMASCAFRSVLHAMDALDAIKPTDTVIIQGTGPLGLLATCVAYVSSARRIIAIGAPNDRLELACEFGAHDTLSIDNSDAEERLAFVRDATQGRGADVVMEFTGNPRAFVEGMSLARRGGTYLVVGQLGPGEISLAPSTFVHRNLKVIGSLAGGAKDYWAALKFIQDHRSEFPFEKLVSNRYSLENVNEAISAMRAQREIKPILGF